VAFDLFQQDKASMLERLNHAIVRAVPFNAALGLRVDDYDRDGLVGLLPYRDELVGNPQTGVLHGGMITSLVDATCGMAVFLRLQRLTRIATIDLRIDYLRPATPPLDVRCRASCYKVTRQVGFVRAQAYHDDPNDLIAAAAGTFMIFDEGPSVMGEALKK
jgi:uncharacterized protein (TIGR00369 family)